MNQKGETTVKPIGAVKFLAEGLLFEALLAGILFLSFYYGGIKGYWADLQRNWAIVIIANFFALLSFIAAIIILIREKKINWSVISPDQTTGFHLLFGFLIFVFLPALSASFIFPTLASFNSLSASAISTSFCTGIIMGGLGFAYIVFANILKKEKRIGGDAKNIILFTWLFFLAVTLLAASWTSFTLVKKQNLLRDQAFRQAPITATVNQQNQIIISLPLEDRDYFYRTFKLIDNQGTPHYLLLVAKAGGRNERDKIYLNNSQLTASGQLKLISSRGITIDVPIQK